MEKRSVSNRFVVVVIAICLAVVLAPSAVIAASGITIFNASNTRSVRVGDAGTLQVESRAGVSQNSFNERDSHLGLGYVNLVQVLSPRQIAITEMTLTALGPHPEPQTITIEAHVRTSGNGTCANPGAGFTRTTLRTLAVTNGSTLTLNFNGPPLVVRTSASNRLVCFGYHVTGVPVGSSSDVGVTGYTFNS